MPQKLSNRESQISIVDLKKDFNPSNVKRNIKFNNVLFAYPSQKEEVIQWRQYVDDKSSEFTLIQISYERLERILINEFIFLSKSSGDSLHVQKIFI